MIFEKAGSIEMFLISPTGGYYEFVFDKAIVLACFKYAGKFP